MLSYTYSAYCLDAIYDWFYTWTLHNDNEVESNTISNKFQTHHSMKIVYNQQQLL